MKLTILIFLISSSLLGCSAAGVIHSSDPNVKMNQALELLKYGRQIPAEKLIKDALISFKESSDFEGGRYAAFQLGMLYANQGRITEACSNYASSNQYHVKAVVKDPDKKYYVMEPFNDWNEMIVALKNKAGC